MARFVAMLTALALVGSMALAGPAEDQVEALKTYISTKYSSDEQSQAMAKSLISQYVAMGSQKSGVVEAASDTITNVNLKQLTLAPQIYKLLNSLDKDLGPQVVESRYMQQNLSNLFLEMRRTLESNGRMRQDAIHNKQFGTVYWGTVIATLLFSYRVAGVIEGAGHPVYGVLAMATMMLGTAAIVALGLGKIWKAPSQQVPKPELDKYEADLIKQVKNSEVKWCDANLGS